jgi:hypothetical protein
METSLHESNDLEQVDNTVNTHDEQLEVEPDVESEAEVEPEAEPEAEPEPEVESASESDAEPTGETSLDGEPLDEDNEDNEDNNDDVDVDDDDDELARPNAFVQFYRNNQGAIRGTTLVVIGTLVLGAVAGAIRHFRR